MVTAAAVLHLPDDPNLAQLRNQARELQRAVRAGEARALEIVAAVDPAGPPAPVDRAGFTLTAAQRALARAYGFPGWPKLRAHLDVIARYRWDPAPETAPGGRDATDEFVDLACLVYDRDDDPARRARARELLATDPGMADRSAAAAAVCADPAALARHAAADPGAAVRPGGPLRWEPLMYLAYSRLDPGVGEAAVLRCARLLLDAGADPDTGRLWRGLTTPFTVLTGCFGEGEQGPVRQPRHPHSLALARVLLEAGADPDDGQALYNRMFRPDDDHLELLFAFGLGAGRAGLRRPWRARLGPALETTEQLFDRQLGWAIRHGFAHRVGLLLDHGVDPSRPLRNGRTPVAVARSRGQREIVALLEAAGAAAPPLRGVRAWTEAALAGDRAEVAARTAADPALPGAARAARPDLIARATESGRFAAVGLLVEFGFSVDARRSGATALHHAAWDGDRAAVEALLSAGADRGARDEEFDGTPQDWAEHAGHSDIVEMLASRPAPTPEPPTPDPPPPPTAGIGTSQTTG